MSEDFLSADIRKKLREFELQVQFTCPACRGRASDASDDFHEPLTNEPSAQADSEAPQQTANIERKGE